MMAAIQVTWVGASAMLFILWAWLLFRGLFQLSRHARHIAGAIVRGIPPARVRIARLANALHNPDHRRHGLQLVALTVALLTLNALGLVIWPTGPG